jgi:hypothetical protein
MLVARSIGVKAANLGVMRPGRVIYSVLLPRPVREAGLSYAGDEPIGCPETLRPNTQATTRTALPGLPPWTPFAIGVRLRQKGSAA